MKDLPEDELLREILTGEDLACFRRASLNIGLAAMRRRRQRRSAWQAGVLVLSPVLLGLALVLARATFRRPVTSSIAKSQPVARPSAPTGQPAVKFISDEELFALFPQRSLALVGTPGRQQLLFLDGEPAPD